MTPESLTHVRLIYQPMSDDSDKLKEICEAMPVKARVSWALRCVKDVAHLAEDIPEVAACIEATEKWLRDEISDAELNSAANSAYAAANSAYAAAHAAYAAAHAAHAAYAARDAANNTDKWNLYKEWYWEELAKWHSSQCVTVVD